MVQAFEFARSHKTVVVGKETKKDLGMACHTPPLERAKKQGEMPLRSLSPITFENRLSLFGGLDSGLDCGTGLWDWTEGLDSCTESCAHLISRQHTHYYATVYLHHMN